MKLSVNIVAPFFDKSDILNKRIRIQEYHGKKIYVAFFRHTGCPFCNLRIYELLKFKSEPALQNLEMIFIFESRKRLLLASTLHSQLKHIVCLSDPEKELFTLYGLEDSFWKSILSHILYFIPWRIKAKRARLPVHMISGNESMSTLPAEFLIDETGIMRKVHYSRSLTDRIALEDIRNFASAPAF
jgi:peroxiredoxin